MIKVKIRFDSLESKKVISFDGYIKAEPVVGKTLIVHTHQEGQLLDIDMGRVINMKPYGDILLVQTTYVVAELWIQKNRVENQPTAVILPFRKPAHKEVKDTVRQGASISKPKLKNLTQILSFEEVLQPQLMLVPKELV